jgi:CubicO group peptidase (beta-lactamase class C family)
MRSLLANAFEPITLSNWRQAPFNRWAFHHVREIIPTADISNDPSNASSVPVDLVDFNELEVCHRTNIVRFDHALKLTNTDGLAILKGGRLVFEYFDNGLDAQTPHILMSVSKSLVGLLTGILVERGHLVLESLVSDILPDIATTAYAGATIRDLLDMRAGIYFDEDYLARSGPIVAYRKATNWNSLEPGDAYSDLRSFFQEMRQLVQPHGGPFNYVSPNTDLLGLVIEQSTGRPCADLMSELIWKPMRASRSAYITLDRLGAPRCAGGICATVSDLARIGQLVAQGGAFEGIQIVPSDWIADMARNGDPQAWSAAAFSQQFAEKKMHYRSQWYAQTDHRPLLFALGIHGQWLIVDRAENIVMAKVSSQSEPLDPEKISLTMSIFWSIREFLRNDRISMLCSDPQALGSCNRFDFNHEI